MPTVLVQGRIAAAKVDLMRRFAPEGWQVTLWDPGQHDAAAFPALASQADVGMGGQPTVNVTDDIIRGQLTVLGSWTFSTIGQADCAAFCASHALPVERLFTHRFALEDAPRAYRMFDKRETGKAVILPA